MTRKSPEQRILDELVRAARTDPTCDFDPRALEDQLRQQWLAGTARERSRTGAARLLVRWVPLALAAAAVLIVGIRGFRHAVPEPTLPRSSPEHGFDGGQLQLGQRILADAVPVTAVHANRATWTLAPHGQAQIVALNPCLTLHLETGRIDADVVPSAQAETFAIETRTHRVAVHGTRFSVAVDAEELVVEVSSGAVVVLERDAAGPNARSLLTAPQQLRFPLQQQPAVPSAVPPVPLSSTLQNRSRPLAPSVEPATSSENPSPSQAVAAAELPLQPTALEQETALDVVRAAAARCFAQTTAADADSKSEVRVRVETRLTLSIAPSGALQEVSFVPPVPPEIAECTHREMAGWSAPPSKLGANPARSIILTN